MAYDLESKIEELFAKVVGEEQDIADGLNKLHIPDETVVADLKSARDEIIKPALKLLDEYALQETLVNRSFPLRLMHFLSIRWVTLITIPIVWLGLWSDLLLIVPSPYKEFLQSSSRNINLILGVLIFSLGVALLYRSFYQHELNKFALSAQESTINEEIKENGIKPFLRSYINSKKTASLDTVLVSKSAPGLWSIMDASFEVPTTTKEKVERMISNLIGGSIGIAGPRGVGKSTLLASLCDPNRNTFQAHTALTILTSVPVKYDSREFILHLYSLVCEKVIRIESEDNPRFIRTAGQIARDRISYGFINLFSRFANFVILALMFGLAGLYLSTNWAYTIVTHSDSLLEPFFKILNILTSPSDIFKVSIVLLIIPMFLMVGRVLRVYIRIIEIMIERPRRRSAEQNRAERELSLFLIKSAESRLEAIQYQRSFSSGWSGGIKLPEAMEFISSSAEYSYSKTRNQLTLPEIVTDYRNFLSIVARKYKILIGIDELDKISSTEAAQQFLNETKAIFGVRGCYYLLSVSDNALSNFERRGIAFRDEFDTSFDDVLFLDTPNIEYSLLLLRRRVIGMPLPFVYYCYVLSGGLPRDLIRVCREVFDIAVKRTGDISLASIAEESVLSDLRSKLRAISIAATDNLIEPEATILFDHISKISIDRADHTRWLHLSRSLIARLKKTDSDIGKNSHASMRKLIDELASYLLFSATLIQYFTSMGSLPKIKTLKSGEVSSLEHIARAKLLITSSPSYSRIVISDFRKSNKLVG